MAGRRVGRALLGSGLLVVTLVGGAGGYGVGLWTTTAQSKASTAPAVPLAALSPSSTPSPPTEPVKIAKPDDTKPLSVESLSYKTRNFVAEQVVSSRVTVKVPRNWWMTQPDPKKEARFTDPTTKRYIRVEAGFTIRRPPAESMADRIATLKALPADQVVKIVSHEVDDSGRNATLVYTCIPEETLRHVIIRWSALDDTGNAAVEMIATGLPQDRDALTDIIDQATDSVTRTDSPLQ